jgi:hypothetical protein
MGVRFGLNPQGRQHRFDFGLYAEKKAAAMMDMRRRVQRQEYPGQLLRDLLIQVYPIQCAWNDLDKCFTVGQQESNVQHALESVTRTLQAHEETVAADADALLSRGVETGGISFAGLAAWVKSASRGDNSQMEELEFSYVCFSARRPVFSRWAALGLSGIDKASAYLQMLDFTYSDDQRRLDYSQLLGNYGDASVCFGMSIAASMSGGPGFPGAYRPLPPLW